MRTFNSFLVLVFLSASYECCRIVIRPPTIKPATPAPVTTRPSTSSSCKCGVSSVNSKRIVGGEPAKKNEFPWQVSLVRKWSSRPFCGGSLLSSNTVLTAAHCETIVFLFRVHLGEHDVTISDGEQVVAPSAWISHPNYDGNSNNNDFAIIRLSRDVTFSNSITPICLPDPTKNYEQREVMVTGWGYSLLKRTSTRCTL